MAEKQAKEQEGYDLDALRHSTSHVMAEAVLSMFPDAQPGLREHRKHRLGHDMGCRVAQRIQIISFLFFGSFLSHDSPPL